MIIRIFLILLSIILLSGKPQNVQAKDRMVIAAWVPYWIEESKFQTVEQRINYFNEISPFAFEVQPNGTLKNTLKTEKSSWQELFKVCRTRKIPVIPTLLWVDSGAMHSILSNAVSRRQHISSIMDLIKDKGFNGIDIDYEGKDAADKNVFSIFIKELSLEMKSKSYSLYCTIEPRLSDTPPQGWQGPKAMAWANDYAVLNKYCDKVRVMAYDQFMQTNGGKEWQDTASDPYIPNADLRWVEKVLQYTLKTIDRRKITLGIPTYSWDFAMSRRNGAWDYKCLQSLSYPEAMALASKKGIVPARDAAGELYFSYEDKATTHLVSISDAESMRQKLALAEKYGLNGVVFFKMDGWTDAGVWNYLP